MWWRRAASRMARNARISRLPQRARAFANVQWFFGTFIGLLVLFGYTWGLVHHTLGGIRHLIWDTGRGLDPPELQWLARATIAGSIVLTLVIWVIGYLVMNGVIWL